MVKVTWRFVPGYERLYEVSSDGRVRSFKKGGKLLAISLDRSGYQTVHLSKCGKATRLKVHKAVLLAFVGPPGVGQVCCHADNDRLNNRVENLRWDSMYSNNQDRKAASRYAIGEKNHLSKFTDAQIAAIKQSDLRPKDAMKAFDISKAHLWRIRNGLVRSHV